MATFSNFYINAGGMYSVLVNVKAAQDTSYNFNCLSEPIVVKNSVSTSSIDTSSTPNLMFNFTGDFTSLSSDTIKQLKSKFYNCIIYKYNLVSNDVLTMYKGLLILDFLKS